jgi:hypothetical protein
MVTRVAAAVAATGLPGAVNKVTQDDIERVTWPALRHAAKAHGLLGILLASCDAGLIPLTDEQREEVAQSHTDSMARILLLERLLLDVVHLLGDAGVPVRVLKGSAVAHLDYPTPSMRPFSDVDLLVRGDDFEKAGQALRAAGCVRPQPPVRRLVDRRFSKGATFVAPDGSELDLHRTLATGPFGVRIRLEELWASWDKYELAGSTLEALSAEGRILHTAYHAMLGGGPPRLIVLRDLAEMLLYGEYDDDTLREMCRSWRAESVFAAAVRETWQVLDLADVTAVSAWAEHYRPAAEEGRLVEQQRRGLGSYAAASWVTVRSLPRWRDRVVLASALAVPSREFLESRGTGVTEHLVRGLRRALRGGS